MPETPTHLTLDSEVVARFEQTHAALLALPSDRRREIADRMLERGRADLRAATAAAGRPTP